MFPTVYTCADVPAAHTEAACISGCISPIQLIKKHIYQIHNQYKFAYINEIYISYKLYFIYIMIIYIIHLLIAILS